MLTAIIAKLPMRNKPATAAYYEQLGFDVSGREDYEDYLMIKKDGLEIHFFLHPRLDPLENDGQIYLRTNDINRLYALLLEKGVAIHPNGALAIKPWGQKEFSLLDPDHNLLTFGESI